MTIHKKYVTEEKGEKYRGFFMVKAAMGLISVVLFVLIYGVAFASILM